MQLQHISFANCNLGELHCCKSLPLTL